MLRNPQTGHTKLVERTDSSCPHQDKATGCHVAPLVHLSNFLLANTAPFLCMALVSQKVRPHFEISNERNCVLLRNCYDNNVQTRLLSDQKFLHKGGTIEVGLLLAL